MKDLGHDADGITFAIIPRPCRACESVIDRLYLYLEVEARMTASGPEGSVQAMSRTPCCGHASPAHMPAAALAEAIEHVNLCPNHPGETLVADPGPRLCRHPHAQAQALGHAWKVTCPDCPAVAYARHRIPQMSPWHFSPKE
jgi:hypothetical protein